MRKSLLPLFAATALLLASCGSHKPVTTGHINTMEQGKPGNVLYYSLPRTVTVIDVEVTMTKKIPGPYAEFANRYLGLEDVIRESSEEHVISSVSINSFVEPDPDHIYYVNFPEDEDDKMLLTLNEAGLIQSFNVKLEEGRPLTPMVESKHYNELVNEATFNHYVEGILVQQIDTIIETVPVDTLLVQRQTLRRSWVEKSPGQRASEVAEHILDIREKKLDLISGFQEINYSKEAIEYMYSEMDRIENDYLDLFTGISSTRRINYRFVQRPEKEDIARRHRLFRFSAAGGLQPSDSGIGFPVTITYDRSKTTDGLQSQIARHTDPRRRSSPGFHYRIPEYADLVLYVGEDKRAEARVLVNQFGIVTHLPPGDVKIEYHPVTGSIKSVGLTNKEED